jgi:hypothetical protein
MGNVDAAKAAFAVQAPWGVGVDRVVMFKLLCPHALHRFLRPYRIVARKRTVMRNAVVGISFLVMIVGCGGIGAPIRDVNRTVDSKDITGQWRLTSETLALAEKRGLVPRKEPYTVTFHADGTCTFDSIVSEGGGKCKHVNVFGQWIMRHDRTGDSNIVYHNLIEMNLPEGRFHFGIDERNGQMVLWQVIGDPDLWEFLEHERGA